MQSEIRYNGIVTRPSDPECLDGDLSLSVNLINEDGNLKPILPLKKVFSLAQLGMAPPVNNKLLYIHRVNEHVMYIIRSGNSTSHIYICKLENGVLSAIQTLGIPQEYGITQSVTSIGTTLIIHQDTQEICHALFKEDRYILLGSKPPFINLSFGLKGVFVYQKANLYDNINDGNINYDAFYESFNGAKRVKHNYTVETFGKTERKTYEDLLTNKIMPALSKFVKTKSIDAGKFMMPFFVRYAYRLYDGTHIMHSSPILMVPNSNIMASLHDNSKENQTTTGDITFANTRFWLFAMASTLDVSSYQVDNRLKDWSDIITGIDIFISAPIYTYDQNGKIDGWTTPQDPHNSEHYFSDAKLQNIHFSPEEFFGQINFTKGYTKNIFPALCMASEMGPYGNEWFLNHVICQRPSYNLKLYYPSTYINIPKKENIKDAITSVSLFYKATTLSIEDALAYNDKSLLRKSLDISPATLKTLEQRERLTDDYNSHNGLMAGCKYIYNSRLYLANVSQKLVNDFTTYSLVQYTDPYPDLVEDQVFVFIKKEGKECVLLKRCTSCRMIHHVRYLYYPDPNAYKIVLKMRGWILEFPLKPSDFLNGAYWFGNFADVPLKSVSPPTTSVNNIISGDNLLFASEVNNPFTFLPQNINTIGTNAKIIAISSTTKAISQGQFGQFPIYVFKEDGVWATTIGDNGSLLSIQPVTRDVANNAELLQTDKGIIFCTQQGLMLINGPESIAISDIIDENNFDTSKLPLIKEILLTMDKKDLDVKLIPFKDYIINCKLAYDYTNSRIYVTNKDLSYSYVYSLKDNLWSTINKKYVDVVSVYPTSLVVDDKQNVSDVSLFEYVSTQGLIISKPLKLGLKDVLKTIREVIHRSMGGGKNKIKSALYGSIDCDKYYLIASSDNSHIRRISGTPFKYFVFVIGADLSYGEELLGTSLIFDTKRNNKLR